MPISRASIIIRAWTDARSQQALVDLLRREAGIKVGQTTVSGWVRGSTPNVQAILALHRILGIDPEDWFKLVVHRARARRKPDDDDEGPSAGRTGTED